MAIASDISIDYTNKIIGWGGTNGFYTVLDLYSYLMATFDDPNQLDDTVPIQASTPNAYEQQNGWYFTQELMKHLKGGSIETTDYNGVIQVLTLDGTYANASSDVGESVEDDSVAIGTLLEADDTNQIWYIRSSSTIADNSVMTIPTGTGAGDASGASVSGEDLYTNIYSISTIEDGNIYVDQNGSKITTWWDGSASGIRKLIFQSGGYTSAVSGDIGKAVVGGTTGDTGILAGYNNTSREWFVYIDAVGDAFDVSEAITITTGTGAGTTTGASTYAVGNSSGENTSEGDSDGSATFTHIDIVVMVKQAGTLIDSGLVTVYNRNYADTYSHSEVDLSGGSRLPAPLETIDDSAKVTTSEAAIAAYVHTDNGGTGATANIRVLFAGPYAVDVDNDGSTETYQVKIECDGQTASIVYQALQWMCAAGRDGETLNGVAAPLYISYTSTYTPFKAAPFAAFAGGKLLCAQGVYPDNIASADASNYQAQDEDGVTVDPPTTIVVEVTGLVATSAYDYVAAFKTVSEGGAIDKSQFTSHASSNAQGDNDFVVSANIPADTPATGWTRIVDDSATMEYRIRYASWTSATFTYVTAITGSCTSTGSGTAMISTSTNFSTSDIEVGDMVRNTTDGSWAQVKEITDEDNIVTTTLQDGSDNTWSSGDNFSFHTLPVALTSSDTAYVGYIDDFSAGASISDSLQYVSDRYIQIYVRNNRHSSDKMKPAEAVTTMTNTGFSVPISRIKDAIST